MKKSSEPTRRRVFIKSNDRICQLFSFSQSPDGSIYCASPDFADAIWISAIIAKPSPLILVTDEIGEGKVSFHGSGMTAVRPNNLEHGHRLVIKGNKLIDKKEKNLGIRHLFTIFPKEPNYQPRNSPLYNRQSDYCLNANEELTPFIGIFFAIPLLDLEINFGFSLSIDDMNNIPNDILGLGNFSLRYHNVFWFAYRTKHMEKWPKKSLIIYHDGFSFPIIIGTGPGKAIVQFRQPKYLISDGKLTIDCGESVS